MEGGIFGRRVGALGMPRRALRHEDIRLTYAPRWKGNLLNGRRGERKQGRHSKAALSGTDED